jgi:hypothetical protein
MAKAVKDKRVQRAMLQVFQEIDKHGVAKVESAINEVNLNKVDRKSIIKIRDAYTIWCAHNGLVAKPELVAIIDSFVDRRARQSRNYYKPTEADIAALFPSADVLRTAEADMGNGLGGEEVQHG